MTGLATAVSLTHADATDTLSVNTLAGTDDVDADGVDRLLEVLVDRSTPLVRPGSPRAPAPKEPGPALPAKTREINYLIQPWSVNPPSTHSNAEMASRDPGSRTSSVG